ncbi:hypothetical protein J421_4064 [Gemmatirosa kalamazoonensis]|uniref:Uncharacterized protein n=1 Tax=Gemmatirosa kalamazoonensis TaxID=861299 RepID=W0RLE8_9BACT|nr:hypothetical protein J421_4064 [Gemmatirosa kalamazoonensis]
MNAPDPSRSSALPVAKRDSASTARLARGESASRSFARTATSPSPVADPLTARLAVSTGLDGVPAKKCAAVGPPNGTTCARLSPCIDVDTIGTTADTSRRSLTPYVT